MSMDIQEVSPQTKRTMVMNQNAISYHYNSHTKTNNCISHRKIIAFLNIFFTEFSNFAISGKTQLETMITRESNTSVAIMKNIRYEIREFHQIHISKINNATIPKRTNPAIIPFLKFCFHIRKYILNTGLSSFLLIASVTVYKADKDTPIVKIGRLVIKNKIFNKHKSKTFVNTLLNRLSD